MNLLRHKRAPQGFGREPFWLNNFRLPIFVLGLLVSLDTAGARVAGMPQKGQPSLPRCGHTQVWTGKEFIVWGGMRDEDSGKRALSTGGSYRPSSNRWTALPQAGAPSARYGHTAIWTGRQMIVWGGSSANDRRLGNGAAYNPSSRTWRAISNEGAPSPRAGHTAVWTGREMVVWGGDYETTGAAYNPALDTWRPISSDGSPGPRIGHAAVWTGRYVAIWGGSSSGAENSRGSGGLYDPARDRWTSIAAKGAPWGGDGYGSVEGDRAVDLIWTGSRLIAFPVSPGGQPFRWWHNGGSYDIRSMRWTPVSRSGAPDVRPYGAVWNGRRLVALGSSGNALQVSEYSPTKKRWLTVASATTGSFQGRQFTWAKQSGEIMVFGGRWADGRGSYSGGSNGNRGFRIK